MCPVLPRSDISGLGRVRKLFENNAPTSTDIFGRIVSQNHTTINPLFSLLGHAELAIGVGDFGAINFFRRPQLPRIE
jgi:hypothetical protein